MLQEELYEEAQQVVPLLEECHIHPELADTCLEQAEERSEG